MTLLLDTHVWLWWLNDDKGLPASARRQIEDTDNQILVSSISLWEVVIKTQTGKLSVKGDLVEASQSQGITFLPFNVAHAQTVGSLPDHHRDPFDRALLAQAATDRIRLLTADEKLSAYRPAVDVAVIN